MIPVLVLTEENLQRLGIQRGSHGLDIPLDVRVVSARRVTNDAGWGNLPSGFIAVILGQQACEHFGFIHIRNSFQSVQLRLSKNTLLIVANTLNVPP